jgi:predicted amidohydrolase
VYKRQVNGIVDGCGGGAGIWDMDGNLVASFVDNKEGILSYDIDLDELDSYRTDSSDMKKRFFLKDLKEI